MRTAPSAHYGHASSNWGRTAYWNGNRHYVYRGGRYGYDWRWPVALSLGFAVPLSYWGYYSPYYYGAYPYYANTRYYYDAYDDGDYDVVVRERPIARVAYHVTPAPRPPDFGGVQDLGPAPSTAPISIASANLLVYPRSGQSPSQVTADRADCERFAQQQTGFDPAKNSRSSDTRRWIDHRRAIANCLEGVGYAVR